MLGTAVRRPTHFDHLKETKQVTHALNVPHHDDAVRDGLFHTEGRPVGVFGGRGDLGNEHGGAPQGGQLLSEGKQEVPNQLLALIL